MPNTFQIRLKSIPNGAHYVYFKGQKYLLTKETFVGGKTIKLFARSLQGTDIISLNYYMTQKGDILKPCEMSQKKVIDFVIGFVYEKDDSLPSLEVKG
jgi:hypothetical protein